MKRQLQNIKEDQLKGKENFIRALAIVIAFVGVFVFFIKILFF